MSDKIKEAVQPAAEATIPSIHPEVSPHIKTAGDMEHLKRIHNELSGEGVETTGELRQVPTEPQIIDSSQFERGPSNIVRFPEKPKKTTGASLGDTSWGYVRMAKKLKEMSQRRQKGELSNAA